MGDHETSSPPPYIDLMKRCPECGREYDNSMMFCLDDGAELLYGPAGIHSTLSPSGEPATMMLHTTSAPNEAPTSLYANENGRVDRSNAVDPK